MTTARIGIMASHEQVNANDLLSDVSVMEENGLERCWVSDHYMPWWHDGGFAGATWPWLGAALAKTNRIHIGTSVTAPILRYHPAIVAQVFSTLGYMFPNRVFLTVGTGEAVNEVPSGNNWPSDGERFERLKEAIYLIKKLWTEEWVNFNGKYYWVKDSNLYTKPQKPIPLFVAAMKPQSASLAGEHGDGLVTNELNFEILKNKVLPAFKKGADKSGKDYNSLTKAVFIPASYDQDKDKAIKSIVFWKGAMIKAFFKADIHDPREIQENGIVVGNDTMQQMALVISNAEEGIKKIKQYAEIGFTDIVLINSSPNRNNLVKLLSNEIIPQIRQG
ncbi:MAG TPA: TIGR03557 family F420-dependent LLM class oxidoreductase [Nitrososphaeraceae archaeon]|jgi:coenzyme F420-dependent glucose-6-phosphate dehydrogenase